MATTHSNLAALSDELKKTDFDSIPVIDLSDATSPEFAKRKALAEDIRRACLTAGFFYVKNHGVPEPVVADTFAQSASFFRTPEAVKRSVAIANSDNFRGYMGLLSENVSSENKGDYHEAFNLGLDPEVDPESFQEEGLRHSANQWPDRKDWDGAEQFKSTVLTYYKELLALGQRLFPLFALALDLPEDFFADKTRHPAAIMRLLFYPGLDGREVDELMPGIGDHTDYECFTILRQDACPRALQVKSASGWLDATPIPETFVINIGDQFARWTNGVFVSTRHRVLPTLERDRYSIPFFFGCDHDVLMEPIPTCVGPERPNAYEVMKAGDYVHMRLSETYSTK